MTSAVRPSFEESIAAAANLQHVQQWRAAQTVRAHLDQGQGRDDVLDCLGLADVQPPSAS
jgi:hypothetical protein